MISMNKKVEKWLNTLQYRTTQYLELFKPDILRLNKAEQNGFKDKLLRFGSERLKLTYDLFELSLTNANVTGDDMVDAAAAAAPMVNQHIDRPSSRLAKRKSTVLSKKVSFATSSNQNDLNKLMESNELHSMEKKKLKVSEGLENIEPMNVETENDQKDSMDAERNIEPETLNAASSLTETNLADYSKSNGNHQTTRYRNKVNAYLKQYSDTYLTSTEDPSEPIETAKNDSQNLNGRNFEVTADAKQKSTELTNGHPEPKTNQKVSESSNFDDGKSNAPKKGNIFEKDSTDFSKTNGLNGFNDTAKALTVNLKSEFKSPKEPSYQIKTVKNGVPVLIGVNSEVTTDAKQNFTELTNGQAEPNKFDADKSKAPKKGNIFEKVSIDFSKTNGVNEHDDTAKPLAVNVQQEFKNPMNSDRKLPGELVQKKDRHPKREWICFYCTNERLKNLSEFKFDDLEDLYEHWTFHHEDDDAFRFYPIDLFDCRKCRYYSSFRGLQNHYKKVHQDDNFVAILNDRCALCMYKGADLEEHRCGQLQTQFLLIQTLYTDDDVKEMVNILPLDRTPQNEIECNICGSLFQTRSDMREHHHQNHSNKSLDYKIADKAIALYICNCCQKEFQPKDYRDHLLKDAELRWRAKLTWKCWYQRFEATFLRTKAIFGNGLVVFNQNLKATDFGNYASFKEFSKELYESLKQKPLQIKFEKNDRY